MTGFTTFLFLVLLFILRFVIPFVVTVAFCRLTERFSGNGSSISMDGYASQ